jgi:hypothetical protein
MRGEICVGLIIERKGSEERCSLSCDGRGCMSKVGPIFGENKIKRMFLNRGWKNTVDADGERWFCPQCARIVTPAVVVVIIPEDKAHANGYDGAVSPKINLKNAASG